MRSRKTILASGESVAARRRTDEMTIDIDHVHSVIRKNPGIPSKQAIVDKTGISRSRVAEILHRIQSADSGRHRVDYGEVRDHGEVKRGWFVIDRQPHHVVLVQADDHSARTRRGITRSMLIRRGFAADMPGADAAIAEIERRLDVDIEVLSATDLEAFDELVIALLAES